MFQRRMILTLAGAWILIFPGLALADDAGESAIRESVVKISATTRLPDMFRPWTKQTPRDVSGTGIVIEGKRILTNAHVVLYASQLFVEPYQSSEKLVATVEAVSPGMDLAVLKLEDEEFFEKRPPLARSTELPEVKESVLVYGYPQGGSSLSVTKGIVSRIEFAPYNENAAGLRIQVDAAINPGNSGGPALVNDKLVGLIFSKLNNSDNIGYIIPTEEIELFLKDVADGKYDGKPAMYDVLQTLENDALRGKVGLDKKASGVFVHVPERTDGDYPLKEWDLITKIGSHDIDNVGLVKVRDNLRLRFQYLIQKEVKDGKVHLTIIRDGKPLEVDVPVETKHPMLIETLQGDYPPYFVYGPLVFSPVTTEYLGGFSQLGDKFTTLLSLIASPIVTRRGDKPAFDGEQLVVVASPMFPHRIGKGYSSPTAKVIKDINGTPIKNLQHLVEVLRDCKDKFITISFNDKSSETIVFNRQEALKATDDILTDNGVRQQGSEDLLSIWEKGKK
ncbi:PDZ domain-containing protein [Singulisphaera sp. PoT]|uniref:S1C family serine protease n=1 Tax=Singulisphaera sp. PoT TaxID=3411797 RepID=UPI003BF553DA